MTEPSHATATGGTPPTPEPLRDCVDRLDDLGGRLDCRGVDKAFRALAAGTPRTEPADMAEMFAFSVHTFSGEAPSPWGGYFGPWITGPAESGGMFESPGRDQVTPFAIDYWWTRAQTVRHPVLRGRYADLVWDLSRRAGRKPPIEAARLVIDSYVAAVNGDLVERLRGDNEVLRRALEVAIRVGDAGRIVAVRDAILAYERRIAVDDKLGTWGFAFDALVDQRKVPLEPEQEQAIIADLEARLARFTGETDADPFSAEHAATRLASYYRRRDRRDDVGRVMRALANAFARASRDAAPLVGLAWMERVHELLGEFGLGEDAKALGPLLHKLGEATRDGLHSVTAEVKIPTEKVEAYLAQLTAGTPEEVLERIAAHFILRRPEIEALVKRLADQAPIQALVSRTVLDDRGTIVCRIGPVTEDPEGHTAAQMRQSMQISTIFLRAVVEKLVEDGRLNRASLVAYLTRSPLFRADRAKILSAGLDAYLGGDHVTALHVLVPYIEDAFRELVRLQGGAVYQPGRYGGLREVGLGPLLEDPLVVEVFSEDVCFYLRVLLTDVRGLNVRNRVAHGLIEDEACSPALTDRLVHVLLILAQCRKREPDSDADQAPDTR